MRTHRNNINRYRRLLKTQPTDIERRFIESRLSEESAALENLAASVFPLTLQVPPPSVRRTLAPEAMSSLG